MSVANLKIKVSRQSQDMKAMQKEFQTAQLETGKTAPSTTCCRGTAKIAQSKQEGILRQPRNSSRKLTLL